MRTERFAAGTPAELFHYTNATGFQGFFTTGELWGTSLQYVNDATKLILAMERFAPALRARAALEGERVWDNLEYLARQLTPKLLNNDPNSYQRVTTCAIWFSEAPDLLSQWRAYGGGAVGYALGVWTESLREAIDGTAWRLERCRYDPDDQQALVCSVIDNLVEVIRVDSVNLLEQFWPRFLYVAALLKHAGFHEEGERVAPCMRTAVARSDEIQSRACPGYPV